VTDKDFKFLVMKDPDNGLVFVALDSMVGYIKHLSEEIETAAAFSDDSVGAVIVSRAFQLLSERIEKMEQVNGGGKITDI
jgi:F420-dependent methylenetetrahydromethanopterin dehydrogenase